MHLEAFLASELEDVFRNAEANGASRQELMAALHVNLLRETTRYPDPVVETALHVGAVYFQQVYVEADEV